VIWHVALRLTPEWGALTIRLQADDMSRSRTLGRSRTWWPQPMKDGIHALQNGVGKSVNFVADTASQFQFPACSSLAVSVPKSLCDDS
jgi:hypothetical protein